MAPTSIVILGGSFGGVSTAHRLFKQAAKTGEVKITLVSPSTYIYWNIATPRGIVPGQFPDEKLFQPFLPGFKQYGNLFEFVQGTAEKLDPAAKTVTVSTDAGEKVLSYDELVLATGSRTKGDVPWKGRGSYEATRDALHDFQAKVKKAGSIVIGGAGATGVETAGELGFEYGKVKKITLISSGATVLAGTPASVSKTASAQLKKLNVTIKTSTKISGSATTADGKTELTLSDGTKMTTDLYLPTAGLIPNSSYIPATFLNQNGNVVVDEFLHVQGTTDIWAVGDVSAVQRAQFMLTDAQSTHVAKNIGLGHKGKPLLPYKVSDKDILATPIGRKAGTGHMGNMRLPSFMVNMMKGKTYFTQNLAPMANGTAFKRSCARHAQTEASRARGAARAGIEISVGDQATPSWPPVLRAEHGGAAAQIRSQASARRGEPSRTCAAARDGGCGHSPPGTRAPQPACSSSPAPMAVFALGSPGPASTPSVSDPAGPVQDPVCAGQRLARFSAVLVSPQESSPLVVRDVRLRSWQGQDEPAHPCRMEPSPTRNVL
ncbi:hypothetical protein B2J93_7708 [Marssonina coronariae]|uniref:FAD/NAD(P)-binding domain-containing protein n=1 Tax=Diplocarpon coronariae TaxID=2795749 RepID=A0A218ZGT7_9HELO|nr:hypothetical protein B2J93_7708 [Marssonina coronariae]